MDSLDSLIAYTQWANDAWREFVFEGAGNDAYLTRMISHILLAEQVWFQRIYGEAVDSAVFATRTQEELAALAARHRDRYAETLRGDRDRVFKYQRFNGDEYESPISEILLHLITHGSHHRGQMASYASQQKLGAPETSYITYARAQAG